MSCLERNVVVGSNNGLENAADQGEGRGLGVSRKPTFGSLGRLYRAYTEFLLLVGVVVVGCWWVTGWEVNEIVCRAKSRLYHRPSAREVAGQ